MNQDIKTLELAKIYERQGYDKEAFEVYTFLDAQESTNETKAGLKRLENMQENGDHNLLPKENISRLFEKWLRLMVFKLRLENFKKIKARLL